MVAPKAPRCPNCGEPTDPAFKPFCSKRCKLIDLGAWSSESYRLTPTENESDNPDNLPAHDHPDA